MYIVVEIQKHPEGTAAVSALAFGDNERSAAYSRYHTILAAAAQSGLPVHSAAILTEFGAELEHETFTTEEGD